MKTKLERLIYNTPRYRQHLDKLEAQNIEHFIKKYGNDIEVVSDTHTTKSGLNRVSFTAYEVSNG